MPMYALTLTEGQARIISTACELYGRLIMGQFGHLDYALGISWKGAREDIAAVHATLDALEQLARPPELRPCGYYGIHHPKLPDDARVAFDVYCVLRHRLANDRLQPGEQPGITVDFDEPRRTSTKEPLAHIQAIKE